MNESLAKYLAGLCDADGTLTFNVSNNCLRLHLSISNDKRRMDKLVPELLEHLGGKAYTLEPKADNHATQVR